MSKTFYVQPGYEVLSHGAWHRAGLLLWVEPGGTVDIFRAPDGKRASCVGSYDYATLDPEVPPPGLRAADSRRDG
jgi:hypothetical protein